MEWIYDGDGARLLQLQRLAVAGARRAPRRLEAWLNLAQIQNLLGEVEDAGVSLDQAAAIVRGDARRQTAFARDLLDRAEPDRALVELDQVLAASPCDPDARRLKLRGLLAAKHYARAHAMVEAGEPLPPTAAGALAMYNSVGLPAEEMLLKCDAALRAQPDHADAIYHKAIALARLGRTDEARAIIDLERLVRTFRLPTPPGYRDVHSFCAMLATEILANPTLVADPKLRSTRHGHQAPNLLLPGATAIFRLIPLIEQLVEAYVADRPAPKRAKLNLWGVILGAEGFQQAHRHPSGWLSGVVYVAASKPQGAGDYPGRLVLGKLDDGMEDISACWGSIEIEPLPGSLVLFPSYIPHGTQPSGMAARRISVAFDVIAQAWD